MKVAYLAKARPDLEAMIPKDVDYVIVEAGPGKVWGDDALTQVADADAFVVSMEPVNEQVIDAAPNLKIVQRMGVGYETLDLDALARRGIPACNLEGVNKEAVAEHGMTLMLGLTKRLLEAHRLTQNREWAQARLLTGHTFELKGKTLGIIGLGNTGAALAMRARAFEMEVIFNDTRQIAPEIPAGLGARSVDKETLFRTADIVSVNTDLNATSRHLINRQALEMMRPHALLVCCARGGVIDETALRAALDEGRIAGAGIDVFETEPIQPDNPLLEAPNTLLTSHVAGVTDETTRRIFDWAMENVRTVVKKGQKPRFVRNGVG